MKYYDLRGLGLSTNEKNLLCYLVDKEPILKIREDGFIRISNDFIQNYFEDWSAHIIRTTLTGLQEKGYIEVSIERNDKTEKTRWVKITDKIEEVTRDYSDEIYEDHVNDLVNNHVNDHVNNLVNDLVNDHGNDLVKNFNIKQNNIITEYQNNIFQENSKSTNTQDNTQSNPQDNTEFLCISKKEDPAIEYIKTTKHSESLMDWYLENKNKVSLEKLKKQYDDICKQCKNNYNMIDRAIKNAYYGNYLIFMVPTNNNYQKQNLFAPSVTTDITNPNRTLGYKVSYPW